MKQDFLPSWSLDCKEIKLVNPNGNLSWIFIGRADAEAETPILWPLDVKSWLIWKDPDAGKDWKQEEKEMADDEMVGCINGPEFEQPLGVGDEDDCLVCCSSWGHRVGHNWATELSWVLINPGSLLHLYFEHFYVCQTVSVCLTRPWALWRQRVYHFLKLFFACVYSYQLEKAMAPHSSTLAWKIPWIE